MTQPAMVFSCRNASSHSRPLRENSFAAAPSPQSYARAAACSQPRGAVATARRMRRRAEQTNATGTSCSCVPPGSKSSESFASGWHSAECQHRCVHRGLDESKPMHLAVLGCAAIPTFPNEANALRPARQEQHRVASIASGRAQLLDLVRASSG